MDTRIIILSANDTLLPIYEILCIAYPADVEYDQWGIVINNGSPMRQRLNQLLGRLIEGCRQRERAITNLSAIIHWTCASVALPPYPYHALTVDHYGNVDVSSKLSDSRDFKTLIRDLATTILFQLEEFGLYNKNGFLDYEFYAIGNSQFNEIALKRIPQLLTQEPSHDTTT